MGPIGGAQCSGPGKQRWIDLRDKIIDLVITSPEWNSNYGMYFYGEWGTDERLGAGAYASGDRIASAFQIGVIGEAMDHAYRTTGNEILRERMIAMADFVNQYGLDPDYQYTGAHLGVVDGKIYHNYAATAEVTFWDPVYTTSLVNVLVRGYRYTCNYQYYQRAKHFFERGNKGIYGEPTQRSAPDGVVHHFVDTKFDSSSGNFYLDYNKGELQYTYLLFEDATETADTIAPSAPKNLRVR